MNEYCASWCGRGCTRAEFEKANRKARKLANQLGKGWEPFVWENLGWYWSAVNGGMKVHPSFDGYTAFLGEPDNSGGRWAEHGNTPKAAVDNVIAKAEEERDLITSCIDAVRGKGGKHERKRISRRRCLRTA